MFTSKSLKVTFLTIFASLALMLGMFASTGIASAHTATSLQSKASTSQSVDQRKNRRCVRTIEVEEIFIPSWNTGNQWNNGWGGFQQNQSFQFHDNDNSFFFNPDQFGFFHRSNGHLFIKVTITVTCGKFKSVRFFTIER
jgi:hypothetical protein